MYQPDRGHGLGSRSTPFCSRKRIAVRLLSHRARGLLNGAGQLHLFHPELHLRLSLLLQSKGSKKHRSLITSLLDASVIVESKMQIPFAQ